MANDAYKMQPSELKELRNLASEIQQRDAQLGNFLHALVHHVGHAHGLDAAEEDAKAADAQSKQDAKASTKGQN